MRYTVRFFLFLLILGIIFVGCYLKLDSKAKTERYTGPQTVEALMGAFDDRYSSHERTTTAEILQGEKRHIAFTLADMDTKYPREEWLQMLLNKGITIENFKTYSEYLDMRSDLILEEFYTGNDWEIVKASYINTLTQEAERITEANRANPEVESYFMIGENALPQIPGRIYVLKTESTAQIWHTARALTKSRNGEQISAKGPELSEKQELDLLNTGIPPAGWEVVYVDEQGNPTHRNRQSGFKKRMQEF